MFPEWTVVVGFYLGAVGGSFLNMLIYRLPRAISLWQPRSHCPNCKHALGVLDLVPIFSFLLSGQRCRYCRQPISWRYFWVEVFAGVVWAGSWWQHLVAEADPARFVAVAVFGTLLIAAIFIDIAWYIIPDSINAWLLGVGLAYNGWLIYVGDPGAFTNGVPSAVLGAAVGVGVLWGIAFLGRLLFGKDSMGHGDIKLARGIGAVLFVGPALLSFGLAVAVGAVFGVVQVLLRKRESVPEEAGGVAELPPESFGSLLRCGLGYLLAIDVLGLFFPKLDRWWFGEEEQSQEEPEDDWKPTHTTIPFGPYLAMGALLAAYFQIPLFRLVDMYWKWAIGGD